MLQEIWNILSKNPILSGVTVLFLGFVSRKIYKIIFTNPHYSDLHKVEVKLDNSIKLEKEDNKSESHFKAGDILRVGRFEDNQYFCTIEVLSVSPITLDELTEQHAKQENMGLAELKEVIRGIYPCEYLFWIIEFTLA